MNYLAKIREKKIPILIVTAVAVGISIILTFIQPFEYRSSFSLLVIEKNKNLDAYAAAKSAERLSLSLGEIVYTTSFYDKVISSGNLPSSVTFPEDEQARRKLWRDKIETRVSPDVGMVKISVYDVDKDRSKDLANSLAIVLSEQGTEYVGGGNSITLKIVDYPITSKNPTRPNIVLNIVAGLIIGLVISIGYYVTQAARGYGKDNNDNGGSMSQPDNLSMNEPSEVQDVERPGTPFIQEQRKQLTKVPFNNPDKKQSSNWNRNEEEFNNFE
ncbi:hypothetical protein KJ782_04030 [Patescibacteria group bacterium]|nr:hypothetical protein [Patescibacteria group bacterium]